MKSEPASFPISGTPVPKGEIDRRIRALQSFLVEQDLDGALLLQNTDLYYFAGTVQQSHLYVPSDGPPVLMVRKSHARARAESPLEHVVPLESPKALIEILEDHGISRPGRLAMELDVLPANLYFSYARLLEPATILDGSHGIRCIRSVKSQWECDRIREAARRSDRLAAHVREILREGIPEIELAGLLEAKARALGHQGVVRMRMFGGEMFYGHLMAGPSAALPSFLASPTGGPGVNPGIAQGAGFRPVGRGEPVLVDYVFAYDGYLSDETRIFSVGELPSELRRAHAKMLDIQETVRDAGRPGVAAGVLYEIAHKRAAELGVSDHFMGVGPGRIRFVGHGVGLELDEYPFLAEGQEMPLAEGMIIALEPKLILPGVGVVGIENTHVVGPNGLESLTRADEEIAVV